MSVLYCACPSMKCCSQHEPFRSAPSAFDPERKDRIWGERKMRIDYQRGWWNGLQRDVYSTRSVTYGCEGSQFSHGGPNEMNIYIDTPTDRDTDTQTETHTGRETDIQTEKHTYLSAWPLRGRWWPREWTTPRRYTSLTRWRWSSARRWFRLEGDFPHGSVPRPHAATWRRASVTL